MSDAPEFAAILTASFAPFHPLSPETISELLGHYELLVRWNKTLNLTSIARLEEAVLRHYCESLFLGIHLPVNPVSVLDVGSGAGFPGIPMAILRPDCGFTLAESHQRKAVFLREATRHLPNVRVAACRAENVEGAFDWVVSRAVKWADVLKVAGPDAEPSGAYAGAGPPGPAFSPSSQSSGTTARPTGASAADPGVRPTEATMRHYPGAARPARTIALLLGQDDAAAVVAQPGFAWRPAIPLPWGQRRVLVLGQTGQPAD